MKKQENKTDGRKNNKGIEGVAGRTPKFDPKFGESKQGWYRYPSGRKKEIKKQVDDFLEEILKPYLSKK